MNDSEFRRRFLMTLFLHPIVAIPGLIGAFTMCLSLTGVRQFRVIAALAVGVAIFSLFARVCLCFNSIAHKTFMKWQRDTQRRQSKRLDDLDRALQADEDTRDEVALRKLRSIYKVFVECVQDGRVREYNFLNTAEKLFHTSIQKLDESMDVWRQAMTMPGDKRQPFMDEREKLITEVENSVETLTMAVHQVQRMTADDAHDLIELREEMESSLERAQRVEARIAKTRSAYGES